MGSRHSGFSHFNNNVIAQRRQMNSKLFSHNDIRLSQEIQSLNHNITSNKTENSLVPLVDRNKQSVATKTINLMKAAIVVQSPPGTLSFQELGPSPNNNYPSNESPIRYSNINGAKLQSVSQSRIPSLNQNTTIVLQQPTSDPQLNISISNRIKISEQQQQETRNEKLGSVN